MDPFNNIDKWNRKFLMPREWSSLSVVNVVLKTCSLRLLNVWMWKQIGSQRSITDYATWSFRELFQYLKVTRTFSWSISVFFLLYRNLSPTYCQCAYDPWKKCVHSVVSSASCDRGSLATIERECCQWQSISLTWLSRQDTCADRPIAAGLNLATAMFNHVTRRDVK